MLRGLGKEPAEQKEGRRESQSVRSDDLDAIRLQGRAGVGVHAGGVTVAVEGGGVT